MGIPMAGETTFWRNLKITDEENSALTKMASWKYRKKASEENGSHK